ncbi:MAG: RsmD family RNA methyltransferase [Candidatus Aenigmarchaeota archaeon]|nr:RsmD family RNA methyltransferase [Candidatus Aenigmarchaeota archaeon]
MLSKKELEIKISRLKGFVKPKKELEQYITPDNIVAEMVHLAYMQGNIKNKIVLDSCSGTGKIAIAASFYGPKIVIGVEKDRDVIRVALENRKLMKAINTYFVLGDALNLPIRTKKVTVLQNPPFGIINKDIKDVDVVKVVSKIADWVYSIHKGGNQKTRDFLVSFYKSIGFNVLIIKEFLFTIPRQFDFHKKPKTRISVDLYVAKRLV